MTISKPSAYEEGDPNAKILILGEAPASVEERVGRLLSGPSGQLFDFCLHQAGLIRRQLYILNLFPFRVKKDEVRNAISMFHPPYSLLWSQSKGFTEEGMEATSGTLQRIRDSRANVVCPLGGVALDYLVGESSITKWRGSILFSDTVQRKVIGTIHPAASLRGKYTWRYLIIHDLARVKAESASKNLNLPERELVINPSYPETIAILRDAQRLKRYATDFEILGGQISCFSISPKPSTSYCIPLLDAFGKPRWSEEQEAEIWLQFAKSLENEKIEKVNQNILFEMFIAAYCNNIIIKGKRNDPMLGQHIMYPDFPKGLDFICSIRTREPYYKDDGKIWKSPWKDMDKFWRYNARDSAVALEAWDDISGEIDSKGYRKTYDMTIDLLDPLLFMMMKGFSVNLPELEKTKERITEELKVTQEQLDKASDYIFNPLSPKQCAEYFYVHKQIKPYVSVKTKKVTTDDLAMARIVRRYNLPEARLVQRVRQLNKLLGTYLEVGIDRDGRIRCSYNPRGTTTGRLSSSETIFGTGMNLQNLHPEFRQFLEADR